MRDALSAEHSADLSLVEAGESRRAQRHQQRRRLPAVRVVGRVDDLLRRHLAVEVEQVDGAPRRRCRSTRRASPAKREVRFAMSAMPACAMISCTPAQRSHERVRGARRSAAGRGRRGSGSARRARAASSNTGRSRSSSSEIRCARGCSLMPRAPASMQRSASSIGVSFRSSRTNGISRPSDCARVRERAVVRRAKRRMPVGLVEAEHERALDAVLVHQPEQLVAVGRPSRRCRRRGGHARRRSATSGRQLAEQLVLPGLEQLLRLSSAAISHFARAARPGRRRSRSGGSAVRSASARRCAPTSRRFARRRTAQA